MSNFTQLKTTERNSECFMNREPHPICHELERGKEGSIIVKTGDVAHWLEQSEFKSDDRGFDPLAVQRDGVTC